MTKIEYVVARRADVPADRFYDYWLNSHGPRVRGHANAIHACRKLHPWRTRTVSPVSFRQVLT
jgi:hypothetical protein